MSYVVIWLQACLHWRCAYFQTLSWNDTIFVVDWDILYKLCGSANKWSKGFVFPGKIWWQFFSCNKACSKYHTRSTTTPKYTLTQRLVQRVFLKLQETLKWISIIYIFSGAPKLFFSFISSLLIVWPMERKQESFWVYYPLFRLILFTFYIS